MDIAATLRDARGRSELTQAELARRTGTSQATISAYESGRKLPSVSTLSRLLAATGARLVVEPAPVRSVLGEPSAAQHASTARALAGVLALAEALPTRHEPELRFPQLPVPHSRAPTG